ncbi:hypothetical protein ACIPLC_10460 [Kitasatospora sp. NPDC086801]|uniref:hypothetical protein n=1 Tax=Kitasatospora sp. NPDC086801 TaxID=3364066 RepID=UPI00381E4EF4
MSRPPPNRRADRPPPVLDAFLTPRAAFPTRSIRGPPAHLPSTNRAPTARPPDLPTSRPTTRLRDGAEPDPPGPESRRRRLLRREEEATAIGAPLQESGLVEDDAPYAGCGARARSRV